MSILDDNTVQNVRENEGLRVTSNMKQSWMVTSKWAIFFAVLGFIYLGLSLLWIGTLGANFDSMLSMMDGDEGQLDMLRSFLPYTTAFSMLPLVALFFVYFFHLRFARQMQYAINFTDQVSFEKSWLNLRNHFRIYGIIVCVMIVFYIIMLAVMAASLMAVSGSLPME